MQQHKYFYERNLPHYQPEEGTYFVTYRLFGSIPLAKITDLKSEFQNLKASNSKKSNEEVMKIHGEYFKKFDSELDNNLNDPYWLKIPDIRKIVNDSLHFNAGKQYNLWCFSIMPNHVHVLFSLLENSIPLYSILQKHKRFTAWQTNKILGRNGSFWHKESYDHLVRDAKSFNRVLIYILNNPVKAGFVNDWQDWEGNYLNPDL